MDPVKYKMVPESEGGRDNSDRNNHRVLTDLLKCGCCHHLLNPPKDVVGSYLLMYIMMLSIHTFL